MSADLGHDAYTVELLRSALVATLMFYRAGVWTDADRERWKQLTGGSEATTKVLCDAIRIALDHAESQFRVHSDTEATS